MARRLFIFALVGLLTATVAVLLVGEALTRPVHRKIGAAPTDLNARTVTFATSTGSKVAGWMVDGPNRAAGAVLLLHGVRSDRRQMIERARFLKQAGYAALLIDLPAHGESEGARITFGWREADAVAASVAYLRGQLPGKPVAVVAISLGAASTVFAKLAVPPAAVVLESMYPTITDAVEDRLELHLGRYGRILAPLLLSQLPLRLDIRPSELAPIGKLARLGAPLLIVSGDLDRHTTLAETEHLYAAASQPKQLWVVQGAAHVDLHKYTPASYEKRILEFLQTSMQIKPNATLAAGKIRRIHTGVPVACCPIQ